MHAGSPLCRFCSRALSPRSWPPISIPVEPPLRCSGHRACQVRANAHETRQRVHHSRLFNRGCSLQCGFWLSSRLCGREVGAGHTCVLCAANRDPFSSGAFAFASRGLADAASRRFEQRAPATTPAHATVEFKFKAAHLHTRRENIQTHTHERRRRELVRKLEGFELENV